MLPAVVMVVRAAAEDWVPLFDAAYFTVRARDVATAHNPLVGAWSMGSREVGTWLNNLGPLQLDVLAPFTKLDPYWGTAAGVAATNIAAIVGVWLVSRRLVGPIGVVGAMAATVLLELNEGSLMLIEARQQLALILPMWCTLWLAAATWMGQRWALPWLVLTASFVLQTHFTYAYQTLAIAGAAAIGFVLHHRQHRGQLVRPALLAAAVLALCWVQPLWDQLFGTGNAGEVFGQSGGSARSVGTSTGLRILAESVFVPPFFAPGSMGDLLREGRRPSLPVSVLALIAWSAPPRRRGAGDAASAPRPGSDGDHRQRCVRRIRVGGDQDPTDRAVRDHRPELLLDLADRRVHGDGGRRQRPAATRTTSA